eukprot:CAMPEP_0114604012 /NCGR_PEP_ID=MMETSP0168-20121206/327_1 /TAXON_ID=95228 ORGANISM="Vannella sp., Strain DIVA3 517/6/12" /NCGR_SAMPLE_ID=MMETSP0168 /ASSEMBLY_ACC=CAM_ASM_000044 /LENGTH=113 /DNA_ID=CAMNT_0001814833 /DNA_START=32 /DNA_END=373 /DNA_ORIENTATION=+
MAMGSVTLNDTILQTCRQIEECFGKEFGENRVFGSVTHDVVLEDAVGTADGNSPFQHAVVPLLPKKYILHPILDGRQVILPEQVGKYQERLAGQTVYWRPYTAYFCMPLNPGQ